MKTYISFLRGVNVGGKMLSMEKLKVLYTSMNLKNVRTYINSGNIIFTSNLSEEELTNKIEDKIKKNFGMEVDVMIRTKEELTLLLKTNPYNRKNTEGKYLAIGLFKNKIISQEKESLKKGLSGKEVYNIIGREIFICYPDGQATTKFSGAFIEKTLKTRVTIRNLNTMNKLLELSKVFN